MSPRGTFQPIQRTVVLGIALWLCLLTTIASAGIPWFGRKKPEPREGAVPEVMAQRLVELGMEAEEFVALDDKPLDAEEAAQSLARSHYALGAWRLARGEYEEAQAAFEIALKSSPESIPIRLGVARATLMRGKADRAIEICQNILGEDAHAVEARLLIAQSFERSDDVEKAIEAYRMGLADLPESLPLLQPLGELYLRRRDVKGTIEIFERVHLRLRKEQRRNLWVMMVLAQYYDIDSQADKSIEMFREATRVYPNQTRVYESFIPLLLRNGRRQEAMAVTKQALIRAPGSAALQGLFISVTGNREAAVKEARAFADEYEQIAEIQSMWGAVALRLGDGEGAKAAYERVLSFDEDHFDALLGLSDIHRAGGEEEKAVALLERAVAAYPDSAQASMALGEARARAGQWGDAEKEYRAVLELAPDRQQAYEGLAVSLAAQGKTDEAVDVLKQAVGRFMRKPSQARFNRQLGDMLYGLGRYDEAKDVYEQSVLASPGDIGLYRRMMSACLAAGQTEEFDGLVEDGRRIFKAKLRDFEVILSDVYRERGMVEEASAALRRAIGADASSFELRLRLISQLLSSKRFEEAEAAIEAAKEAFGGQEKWKLALLEANLYAEQQRFAEALPTLEKWVEDLRSEEAPTAGVRLAIFQLYALALDSEDRRGQALRICNEMIEGVDEGDLIQANRARGYVAIDLEAWDIARQAFEHLVAAVPTADEYHYQLGAVYDELELDKKAEKSLRRALLIDPNNAHALNHLGYMMAENDRDLDEAVALIEKASRLLPNQGFIIDSLGWAYYKQGKAAEAVEHLERAAKLSGDDPVVLDHLGDAHTSNGRAEKAIEVWERSLKLNGDQDSVRAKIDQARKALGDR